MKRSKLDWEDCLALIGGVILVAFAVVTFFAAKGETQVLIYILEGIGVIAVIGGFIAGSFIGAICALIAIAIVIKLFEAFTIPVGILLLAGGIALIVYWLKEYKILEFAPKSNAPKASEKQEGYTSAPARKAEETKPRSFRREFRGQEIVESFLIEDVHIELYKEGKIKVGSEVTVRTDEETDSFEFICGGEVIGEIGNTTYELMKRRAGYMKLLREGRHMYIANISENPYGHICAVDICFV